MLGLAATVIGCEVLIRLLVGRPANPTTVEELTAEFNVELPAHPHASDVKAWLTKKGYFFRRYSGLLETRYGKQSLAELAGVDASKVASTLSAEIPDTKRALFENSRIDLYFFFDAEGSLVGKYFHEFNIFL